jgi:hypothetical protein
MWYWEGCRRDICEQDAWMRGEIQEEKKERRFDFHEA